jgi:hypothetical protein
VCELDGKPVFELIRDGAAALKTRAELYTPNGSFIRCADENLAGYVIGTKQGHLKIGGLTMMGCSFRGVRIGIWVRADGTLQIGVS